MEFTGTFSEGISKADDRIIAAVMWSLTEEISGIPGQDDTCGSAVEVYD